MITNRVQRGPQLPRPRMVVALAVVLAVVGLGLWLPRGPVADEVVAGPPDSTTEPSDAGLSLGGVEDVTVAVEPRTGLRDGDLVEVTIGGLHNLPGATILQCAGYVTEADAAEVCDTLAVTAPASEQSVPMVAVDEQTVVVSRNIRVARGVTAGDEAGRYDCATEAAGCVLAVGPYELPPRAILVPLEFEDVATGEVPSASISPAMGLRDGQEVPLTATGLRRNSSHAISVCNARGSCSEVGWQTATTDDMGELRATVIVTAAIYGYEGRTDCVSAGCSIVISSPYGDWLVELPIAWADGVVAPSPVLSLEPAGPYTDGQVVTVHGSGFPSGYDLNGHLGQCPADKDTAEEERCGYDLAIASVVGPDGTFTADVRLHTALGLTGTCVGAPGCVLAWVIPHGPIAASIPLDLVGP